MTSQCKLLELPPVGEVDHKSGNCYCHLCTCGLHVCPGDYRKSEKYLKSALKSIYKHDFTKKTGSVSEPYIRNAAFNPGCNKMDLKTTSRQDFVEFKCEKTKSARYDKPDSSRIIKFAGVSHYRSEFPNWGHYEFVNVGNCRSPYKDNNIKLSPYTTYTQNFCQERRILSSHSQKKISKANPLTASGTFFPQTTSREFFQGFNKTNFPEITKNKVFGILPLESTAKSYQTTYSTEYDKKEPQILYQKKKYGKSIS